MLVRHRLLVGLSMLVLVSPVRGQDVKPPEASFITETGEGRATAAPDQGRIQGGVVTVARHAAQALATNATAIEALRKALGEQGVDLKLDVRTVRFSITDHYSETTDSGGRRKQEKDGYIVSHTLDVKVSKFADLGSVLDAMVASGANDIDGITPDSSQASNHQDDARIAAVADAHRRASMIARELGYRLGEVIETREVERGRPRMESPMMLGMASAPSSGSTTISGGSLEYTSEVYVKWSLVKADLPANLFSK